MPKVVDHEKRRRELAAAVWRVISRDGVEGVSIRDVAAEAHWSTGALRHYFTTKDDLLAFAARLVAERVTERLNRGPYTGSVRERVRAALCEVLPVDADRRTEAAIWLAFVSRSLVDPRIADEQGVAFDGLRELCEHITQQLAGSGHLAPGVDPEVEVSRLHAMLDGLTLHVLMGRLDTDEMLGVLDAHLGEIARES